MKKKFLQHAYSILISTFISFLITSPVYACTRLLHVDPSQGVFVGRTMDWYEDMGTQLIVYPRGIARSARTEVNPLKWVSRYASIVATSYDTGASDGMNEKGLAIHILALEATKHGKRNKNIPGVSLADSVVYYLDHFKTVDEAVRATQSSEFQMLGFDYPDLIPWIKIHLALEDASGDSAIIEYIDGSPKIYHSKDYTVLTNDPTYNLQLENIKQYEGLGGSKSLPGSDNASDRFVRAKYYGEHLPAFSSAREAVAGIMSVLENSTPPFTSYQLSSSKLSSSASTTSFTPTPSKIYRTLWRTVSDLTHHVYYFYSNSQLTTIYVHLDQFSLQAGSPVMKLDLTKHPELSGNVSKEFEAVKNN